MTSDTYPHCGEKRACLSASAAVVIAATICVAFAMDGILVLLLG